jgi:hypothetical protein
VGAAGRVGAVGWGEVGVEWVAGVGGVARRSYFRMRNASCYLNLSLRGGRGE